MRGANVKERREAGQREGEGRMGGENEKRGEKRMRELGKKMKKQDERR